MILLGVVFVFILGYLVVLLVEQETRFLERIFLAFPIGMGLFTFLMFLINLTGVSLEAENLILTFFVTFSLLGLLIRVKRIKIIPGELQRPTSKTISFIKKFKINFFSLMILFGIFAIVVRSLILNLVWPPETWDTISLYDFRALRFFETKSLASVILTTGSREEISYNYSYPFLTSLSHSFVYIFDYNNPRFLYTFFYISLVGSFFYILRRKIGAGPALLFSGFLAADPEYVYHSTVEYTNLPYAVYFGLGALLAIYGITARKKGYLMLSAICIGLSTWTRSQEPFWIVPALLVMGSFFLRKKFASITPYLYVVIILFFRQSWLSYVGSISRGMNWPDMNLVQTSFSIDIKKIALSILYAFKNTLWRRKASFFILLLSLVHVFSEKRVTKYLNELILLGLCLSIIFVGTYFFSVNFRWWDQIGDSVTRMSMFLLPLFYYFSAMALFDRKNGMVYQWFLMKGKDKRWKEK